MKCTNHLKQWGLAMHNMHDAVGQFPEGNRSNPRRVWTVLVWPYVEAGNIYTTFDQTRNFFETPNTYTNTFNGANAKPVPIYYCPSDRPGAMWQGDIYWRARGNYVVNWGHMKVPYQAADPAQSPTLGIAPFGYRDYISRNQPRTVKITDITDGSSNTMLMSEVIMAAADNDYDIRGDMMNDDRPCTQYMTLFTPNSGTDVSPFCSATAYPRNPPCTTTGSANAHKAARSKHTGGVNVLFGDGHIQFVRNSIDLVSWRAMGTMNGGEVISAAN